MKNKFIKIINDLQITKNDSKVLILGDVILDERYDIHVKKLSQEAPISIASSTTSKPSSSSYGGACNVAKQLNKFGVNIELISMLRKKDSSSINSMGINIENHIPLIDDEHISTKKRFYKDSTMVFRWDVEIDQCGIPSSELKDYQNDIIDYIKYSKDISMVVFSDYNKGMLDEIFVQKVLKILKQKEIQSIVDPKKMPLSKWIGATIIKPNQKEAHELTGEICWKKQCQKIKETTGCLSVIITQEGNGVVGIDMDNNYFEFIPDHITTPENVVGSGDTFVSTLSYGFLNHLQFMEIIKLAFAAGSTYVKNKIPKQIELQEIKKYFDSIESKYCSPYYLQKRNFSLAATGGSFDLFHTGHLNGLKFAKTKAEKLVVLINSDESIKTNKGQNRPILPLSQRMEILANLECVDFIISFDEKTPKNLLKIISPDIFVKGEDYSIEEIRLKDGVKNIELYPIIENISTSKIIEKILKTQQ